MPLCQNIPPHVVNIFLLLGHDASFVGKGSVLTVFFLPVVWSIFMHRILFSEGYFPAAAPVNCLCASPVTTYLVLVVVVVVVVEEEEEEAQLIPIVVSSTRVILKALSRSLEYFPAKPRSEKFDDGDDHNNNNNTSIAFIVLGVSGLTYRW